MFVLVGLAVTSLALWLLFFLRRRRRTKRTERDTIIAAAEARSSFRADPLGEDDHPNERPPTVMRQTTGSALGSGTLSAFDSQEGSSSGGEFNPYAIGPEGYALTRSSSPPPQVHSNLLPHTPTPGHSASPSGASHEPLLAAYYQHQDGQNTPSSHESPHTPPIPPRNPNRITRQGAPPALDLASPEIDLDSTDNRLGPDTPDRHEEDGRDDYDYSRKLGVSFQAQ